MNLFLKYSLLFIITLFSSPIVYGQQKDSLKQQAYNRYLTDSIKICHPKNLRPQFSIDNRKSFVRQSPVDVKGFDAGVLLKSTYRIALGYYTIFNEDRANKRVKDQQQIVTIRDLNLSYVSLNTEYFLVFKRFWRVGIPLEIGLGTSRLTIYNEPKTILLYTKTSKFIPSCIGFDLVFKPIRWVGINGLAGYRKILYNSENRIDYDGWFYSYGILFDMREILKDTRLFFAKRRYKKRLISQ